MTLWTLWWRWVEELRPACGRTRTFLWMATCLMGMSTRKDLLGVTSLIRALGLRPVCYDRLLDFFHSPALDLEALTRLWCALVFRVHPRLYRVRGKPVLIGDGLKVAKAGRKMPAVKKLHQTSDSNTKPEYIFGHSCQAVAVLTQVGVTCGALPLACRIHEGLVLSNRDQRTLLDKMIHLLDRLGLHEPFYFLADAYYASGGMVRELLEQGNHLVTRIKRNSVAYLPAPPTPQGTRSRGRPRKYGRKITIASLLTTHADLIEAASPVYGETNVILRYATADLLWRAAGILVRFVAVTHPRRGTILLMTTDLTLPPLEVIKLYGFRFKIEVSFKQALHVVGTYTYRFWMAPMPPLRRVSGNQYLHRQSSLYRKNVLRKLSAYHKHIQLGLIAQGLMQLLAAVNTKSVWGFFGSWMRTIRPGIPPSEQVCAMALRNGLPEFLADTQDAVTLKKFLLERIDLQRAEGMQLVA